MSIIQPPLSGRVYTDSLVAGPIWASAILSYSFPTLPGQFTGYPAGTEPERNFEALNLLQQDAVRSALWAITSFTSLTFTQLTGAAASSAVLRFGMSDAADTAFAFLPSFAEARRNARRIKACAYRRSLNARHLAC